MCLSIEVLTWRLPTRSQRQFIVTATIISSMGSAPDETRCRWQRSKQQASPRMVDTAQELLRRHWAVLCCAVPTLGQIAAASLSSSYLQRSNGLDTAVRSSYAPRGAIEGPEENWQSSRTSENTYNLERLGPTWSVRRLHVDGTSDRSLALVVECARCGFQKQEEKAIQVSWSDLTYLTTDSSTRLHLWRAVSGIKQSA